MRSIDSYYNHERSEFVQVIDFRTGKIKLVPWEKFYENRGAKWIKRFPFRSELINELDLRQEYLDIHEINKPYGMNFWEFLIDEKLKDDFCEYETKRYSKAMTEWFEQNKVFSTLGIDVYVSENSHETKEEGC